MRFSNDLTRRGAAVALAGALAFGAAACGDDTEDPGTDTGSEMMSEGDDAMSEMESEGDDAMSEMESEGDEMMSEPMESEEG